MNTRYTFMGVALVIGIGIGALATNLRGRFERDTGTVASVHTAATLRETRAPAQPRELSTRSVEEEKVAALLAKVADTKEEPDKVVHLTALLAEEVSIRRRLESNIAALQSQVWKLEAAVANGAGKTSSPQQGDRKTEAEAAGDPEKASVARFLAAGFDPVTRGQLLKRAGEIEMESLNLRYKARREGWLRTPEYREAVRQLSDGLRQELGENLYDRFLFASERTNRLQVESVMESSPAQQTGLQPGDIIVSYDGSRVFSRSDLNEATGRGEIGETVPVEVRRGNEFFEVELPRGPLGVRLDRTTVQP